MTEFDQIIKLLGGDSGLTAQFLCWMAAVRIPMKMFSGKILTKITQALVKAFESPESDDDQIVRSVLSNRSYRITIFLLDMVFSLKLPTLADFNRMFEQRNHTQPK